MALKGDGKVVAWGYNADGQTSVPAALEAVKSIAVGGYHNVALKRDGTLVAWGNNTSGQTDIPADLSGVVAIAAGGFHNLALKTNGTVVAWGRNGRGQTTIPAGLSEVVAIAASFDHSVALRRDGTVVAWGAGTTSTSTFPEYGQSIVPAGLSGVTAIGAGYYHTVALKTNGTVEAWGASSGSVFENDYGQATVPGGLAGVAAIAAGGFHNVVLIGPVITTQPVGQSFALAGGVTLSVGALGAGLSYQWQFNGVNIPGATSPTLSVTNLAATNAGAYRVVVNSTAGGTATSQDANLLLYGDLKFYAGTILAGPVGQQFRVDYADVVNAGTTNWLMLTNVTLPSSPYLVIDPNSPGQTKRFYRAVPVQLPEPAH